MKVRSAIQEQKASELLFVVLEKLTEWLQEQEDLFPPSFGKNYPERVLNPEARANICKVTFYCIHIFLQVGQVAQPQDDKQLKASKYFLIRILVSCRRYPTPQKM